MLRRSGKTVIRCRERMNSKKTDIPVLSRFGDHVRPICLFVLVAAILMAPLGCGGDSGSLPGLSNRASKADASGFSKKKSRRRRGEKPKEAPPLEGPVPINEVTAKELDRYKIPRLGIATARKIVEYREEHGPFRSYEDLDRAPRVGPSMLEAFKKVGVDFGEAADSRPEEGAAPEIETNREESSASQATADAKAKAEVKTENPGAAKTGSEEERVNINTASKEELMTIKGIGPSLAQKILDARAEKGVFQSWDDVDEIPGVGEKKLESLKKQMTLE